jgi:hypothetical protein
MEMDEAGSVQVLGKAPEWPGQRGALMSIHASVLVDSVGPASAEVCRTPASFP